MNEKNIIITTSDLKEDYEILDVAFAVINFNNTLNNSHKQQQEIALIQIKYELKRQCEKIGGDAIINCQITFSNQTYSSPNKLSASGTIVKFKSKQ